MAKNKRSNLIVVNIDFINKHIINLGKGGSSVLVNYQSLILIFFPLASPNYFSL